MLVNINITDNLLTLPRELALFFSFKLCHKFSTHFLRITHEKRFERFVAPRDYVMKIDLANIDLANIRDRCMSNLSARFFALVAVVTARFFAPVAVVTARFFALVAVVTARFFAPVAVVTARFFALVAVVTARFFAPVAVVTARFFALVAVVTARFFAPVAVVTGFAVRAVGRRMSRMFTNSTSLVQERWAYNLSAGSDTVAGVFVLGASGIATNFAEHNSIMVNGTAVYYI